MFNLFTETKSFFIVLNTCSVIYFTEMFVERTRLNDCVKELTANIEKLRQDQSNEGKWDWNIKNTFSIPIKRMWLFEKLSFTLMWEPFMFNLHLLFIWGTPWVAKFSSRVSCRFKKTRISFDTYKPKPTMHEGKGVEMFCLFFHDYDWIVCKC